MDDSLFGVLCVVYCAWCLAQRCVYCALTVAQYDHLSQVTDASRCHPDVPWAVECGSESRSMLVVRYDDVALTAAVRYA